MMPMTVRQVAEAVQGRLIVPQTGDGVEDGADALATSAVSDSRQVREGSVFVAIAGERVDGHRFIPDVFEKARWQFCLRNRWKIRQDRTFW